jgi:hypothetical protein
VRRNAQDSEPEELPARGGCFAQHSVHDAPAQQPNQTKGQYPGELAVRGAEWVRTQARP